VKRLGKFVLSVTVIGAIGAMGAPMASAAEGSADIECGRALFKYTDFGPGTHVIQETVYEDTGQPLWNRLTQVEFTFQGDSATHRVPITLEAGSHRIRPDAWQLNVPNGDHPHIRGFIPPPGTTLACNAPTRPLGSADIDCASATFRYSGFGPGTHVIQETVYEDTKQPVWNRLAQEEFTFEGDSGSHRVEIELGSGSHTIRPDAWQLNPSGDEQPHIRGFIPPPGTTLACGTPKKKPGGTAELDCAGATFTYTGFGAGTHVIQETIYEDTGQPLWNRLTQVEFTFKGDSGTHEVDVALGPGSHTVRPDAWVLNGATGNNPHIRGFIPPPSTIVDCGTPPVESGAGGGAAPCTSGTVDMRWHYAPSGKSGAWSTTESATCPGTLSFVRQAMGRDLRVNPPGTMVQVGYSIKAPTGPITVASKVDFVVRCDKDKTPSQALWTVNLPTQTYNATDGAWLPSFDRNSPLTYQTAVPIPDFCGGSKVRLEKGGIFSARFS
jgi:hypothetical protein